MKHRLLYVEDDEILRPVIERELRGFGHHVTSHASAEGALEYLRDHKVDLALLDLRLPGMSGLDLLREIKSSDPRLPVVMLTGHGSFSDAVEAMRAGAFDFLGKPAPLDELELILERAIQHGALLQQNHVLRNLIDRGVAPEIIGESACIRKMCASIARIGSSEANVVIVGESGTGKELVARAIHNASPRAESAFIVLNCGAIPTELFESELFGHSAGAFTGANKRRLGLFELAEGGTLFLDEVGELPIALQPTLLRAVQFGEFRPVGAERSETADVRILAATNRDLTEAVSAGEFREDLYHRISTLVVAVPPLRDRGDDVRLLAETLLGRHNEKLPDEFAKSFSAGALDRIQAQEWTGNVRELENVIVRLVTLVEGSVIEGGDVDRHVWPLESKVDRELGTLDLEALERLALVQAMKRHQGNRSRAAAELGVATKTLYNKIRHHAVSEEEWKN